MPEVQRGNERAEADALGRERGSGGLQGMSRTVALIIRLEWGFEDASRESQWNGREASATLQCGERRVTRSTRLRQAQESHDLRKHLLDDVAVEELARVRTRRDDDEIV